MNARRPLLLALLLLSLAARADLVVVVNADNPTPALSREEVIHIFLGRYRQFPSGQGAEPYDQPTDSPERNLFYERLVGKSQAQINAYWARLTFSGRTRPPLGATSLDQLIEALIRNPNAIGYVDRARLTRHLKIVYEIGP